MYVSRTFPLRLKKQLLYLFLGFNCDNNIININNIKNKTSEVLKTRLVLFLFYGLQKPVLVSC